MAIESATTQVQKALNEMDRGHRISKLRPEAQMKARFLCLGLAMIGFGKARVVSTWRDSQEQEKIYGYGRSEQELREHGVPVIYAKPDERIRTRVLPGDSDHEKGLAIDFDLCMYSPMSYEMIKGVARCLNIEWGGNWRMRDYGHFGLSKDYNPEDN